MSVLLQTIAGDFSGTKDFCMSFHVGIQDSQRAPDQTNIFHKSAVYENKNALVLIQNRFYPIIQKRSELASWLWFCMCRNIDFGFLGFQEFPSFKQAVLTSDIPSHVLFTP